MSNRRSSRRMVRFSVLALFVFMMFMQVALSVGKFAAGHLYATPASLLLFPACGAAAGAGFGSLGTRDDWILIGSLIGATLGLIAAVALLYFQQVAGYRPESPVF